MPVPDPWDIALDRHIDPRDDPYAADPVGWVDQRLGEQLWSTQRTVAESVRDNRYTAVPSCHDAGKSHLASRLAAWWLDTHRAGEAFVVSTAPTFPQVRAILWRYIGQAHRKGHLVGTVNQTEWWIGSELVGFGRKPADTDPAAFQGIHARAVLVIIDEACGVPKSLWDAVDTLVTNDDCRVLAIGNPDDPTSHFELVCRPTSGWNVIRIDGYETPNLTGEPVAVDLGKLLLSKTWVEERKARWGEDSPLFASKVRGQFPTISADAVVPYAWAEACRHLDLEPDPLAFHDLGVDVGAGGDESVIVDRTGRSSRVIARTTTRDPMALVGLIVQAIRETGAIRVKIDMIGWGWGIAGRLAELYDERVHAAEVYAINVATTSADPARFPLLRDQLWWDLARVNCQDHLWDLSEHDDELIKELIAPKYKLDSRGRIKVEPKDETRKTIGRSPDTADALLLAYYEPPPPEPDGIWEAEEIVSISPY